MHLSIAEREQILGAVHESLKSLIYDDLSGIPEIRQRLKAQGLKLNIELEIGIEDDSSAGQDLLPEGVTSGSPYTDEGLDELRNMGISLEDLREVAHTEAQRNEEAVKMLAEQIREMSSSLSSRGRNYCWGWLNLHYPEIGLGQNPVTIQDERFAFLAVPAYWQRIVETALTAIRARRDRTEALSRFLRTLKFAKANT